MFFVIIYCLKEDISRFLILNISILSDRDRLASIIYGMNALNSLFLPGKLLRSHMCWLPVRYLPIPMIQ